MSYSADICNRIIKCLKDDDWNYKLNTDKETITMGLTIHNKMKHVDIIIDLRDDKFLLFFTCPLNTDENERAEMRILLNRINYNLLCGSFEMDERDGEIRFRYTVDCDNCPPSQEVIRHSLYRSAATLEKYGDAIIKVLMGFATGDEAYAAAQKD